MGQFLYVIIIFRCVATNEKAAQNGLFSILATYSYNKFMIQCMLHTKGLPN